MRLEPLLFSPCKKLPVEGGLPEVARGPVTSQIFTERYLIAIKNLLPREKKCPHKIWGLQLRRTSFILDHETKVQRMDIPDFISYLGQSVFQML